MSMESPQPWPPYPTTRDCSQGVCSFYCPQLCYFLFPPPPSSSSGIALSPLLISIIAIISTAFFLVTYYIILSKYRRRSQAPGLRADPNTASDEQIAWQASSSEGLDESLISKIATVRYRTGEGIVVDDTDCAVCLSQFQDGETLRLLPKCNHAFHVRCIDTWLVSHSNCPLCRATIIPTISMGTPQVASHQDQEDNQTNELVVVVTTIAEERQESNESASREESELEVSYEIVENELGGARMVGRSFSMDSPFRREVPAADIGSSSRWSRALHCVISPVNMKRSSSSGRLSFMRHVRGRSAVLPI